MKRYSMEIDISETASLAKKASVKAIEDDHGMWIKYKTCHWNHVILLNKEEYDTECGYVVTRNHNTSKLYKYCPFCYGEIIGAGRKLGCPICGSRVKAQSNSLHILETEYECGCSVYRTIDDPGIIKIDKSCGGER